MSKYSQRISVHHIGGRGGTRPFPVMEEFEGDIVNVLYDADQDCVEQIRETNKKLKSELHVLPVCLAEESKKITLNINYDPYTSSVFDFDPRYAGFYSSHNFIDYLLSEAFQVAEKRDLDAVTLDQGLKAFSVPPPDFLSIDTQGSEYAILSGGRETLKDSVLALALEAEFHPIYKGQKLFGDTVRLMEEQGFIFIKFLDIKESSLYRAPIGLRGEGIQIYGDALFFRRLETINAGDPEKRFFMLRKLAFIAIAFNQFEYALECLKQSRDLVKSITLPKEQPNYLRFLASLEEEAEKVSKVYHTTFASKYKTFEASKARFKNSGNVTKPSVKSMKMKLLDRAPWLFKVWRPVKSTVKGLKKKARSAAGGYTNVEKLFISYGLKGQADLMRGKREAATR